MENPPTGNSIPSTRLSCGFCARDIDYVAPRSLVLQFASGYKKMGAVESSATNNSSLLQDWCLRYTGLDTHSEYQW